MMLDVCVASCLMVMGLWGKRGLPQGLRGPNLRNGTCWPNAAAAATWMRAIETSPIANRAMDLAYSAEIRRQLESRSQLLQ
jgi:hypothetical protein